MQNRQPEPLVLGIDGNSLAYRAFFAIPASIVDADGRPVNAAYGFLTMLARLIEDHRPTGVFTAFDSAWPTVRHKLFPGYKGTRQPLPQTLLDQIPLLRGLLGKLGVAQISLDGYEADDIIASLAAWFSAKSVPTLLVTGDRDLFQLVRDPLVRVLYTRNGVQRNQVLDEAAVTALVGVAPSRYLDLAALRGDVSDNIAGVRGIGPATAASLVNSAQSLDDLFDKPGLLPRRVVGALEDLRATVVRNRELMKLNTAAPVDWPSVDLRLRRPVSGSDEDLRTGLYDAYGKVVRAISTVVPRAAGKNVTHVATVRQRRRVCLLPCAAEKRDYATTAKELYVSEVFCRSRAWAEMACDQWFILSGLHGLLEPDQVLEPYEKNLNDASTEERHNWARRVVDSLTRRFALSDTLFILLSNSYAEPLVGPLVDAGGRVTVPVAGMVSARRLDWLQSQESLGPLAGDLEEFYEILEWLAAKTEGPHRVDRADRVAWPERGVYFFFEPEEHRYSSTRLRVTRVGTHAVSANSKATLWNRLRTHKGSTGGGGNHRSSIFRSHVGTAILRRDVRASELPHWGNQTADVAVIKESELWLEKAVSSIISTMSVVALEVSDEAGAHSDRAFVERNAIALLSRVGSRADPASSQWLGRSSPHPSIASSGLWNVNYIDEPSYHKRFLEVFDYYARVTAGVAPRARGAVAPPNWWNRDVPEEQMALSFDTVTDYPPVSED